jgi:isopentenyldiphosphate isomerase
MVDTSKLKPVFAWQNTKQMKNSRNQVMIYDPADWEAFTQGKNEIHAHYSNTGKLAGYATRKSLRKLNLVSRASHVFVFNNKGELFLQRRASTKDIYPNLLAPSASGHLDLNETSQQAAERELSEELGIEGKPKFLGKIKCFSPQLKEFLDVFALVTDSEIKINEKEISKGFFVPLSKVYVEPLFSQCIPAMQKELKTFKKKLINLTK